MVGFKADFVKTEFVILNDIYCHDKMTSFKDLKQIFSYSCATLNFSFSCGENWHDPVKCKWLRRWIKKCDDDSETSNWIAANTKVLIFIVIYTCVAK